MFGREKEREILESLYEENRFRVVLVTGEGMGRGALLRGFLQHKTWFWFTVRPVMPKENERAWEETLRFQSRKGREASSLADLVRLSKKESVVLVIDGAERIDAAFPNFQKNLAEAVDDEESARLLVIFCAERPDGIIKTGRAGLGWKVTRISLGRLSFEEADPFYSGFSQEEKLFLYGAADGRPGRLRGIRAGESLSENLYRLFFAPDALFTDFGERELRRYFREVQVYHAVMEAVAQGAAQMQDIAAAVGWEANRVSKYVAALTAHGFLLREMPAGQADDAKRSKKTFYRIEDMTLIFWYLFVLPHLGSIRAGMGNAVLRRIALPGALPYLRDVFFCVCGQHLRRAAGKEAVCGFYWETPFTMERLLLLAEGKRERYAACCLCGKKKADVPDIQQLFSAALPAAKKETHFVVYSRKGFTERALAYSFHCPALRLVSLMYMANARCPCTGKRSTD